MKTSQALTLGASAFAIFLCVSFGANAIAIKLSLTGLGIFTAAAIRFTLSAAAIACWAAATGRPLRIQSKQWRQLLIVSIMFTFQIGLFYHGLNLTYASRGTLIANLQPFMVLLLAHRFIPEEPITPRKLIGILMGFTGVVCLLSDTNGITGALRIGDGIIFITAFIWAANTVYMKKIIPEYHPFQLVLYPMLFAAPFYWTAAFFLDTVMFSQPNATVVGAILYQGLFTAAFGFVAWSTLLKKYGAVALHSYLFILPLAGVGLGGLVLGEPIASVTLLLALLFIVGGIVVVHARLPFMPFHRPPM